MMYIIRCCPVPCKFGKILVVRKIIHQNFSIWNYFIKIFIIFLFTRYETTIIKQSFSCFFENFPNLFAFVSLNEVSQSNIFLVFFLYIWLFKVNSNFIISGPAFCSVSSISIGSFSFSSISFKLLLYFIKVFATGRPVGKLFLWSIWDIVYLYWITTRSDNSNVTSIN